MAARYDNYIYEYAKLKSLVYENGHTPASPEQKYRAGKYAKTALQQLLAAEEARKVTTIVQQQEEEFLKVAMKPSDMNMDFRAAGVADSIKAKRSSIFNIPQDRLRQEDGRTPSPDSLLDLMTGRRAESPATVATLAAKSSSVEQQQPRHFSQTYEGSLMKREVSVERLGSLAKGGGGRGVGGGTVAPSLVQGNVDNNATTQEQSTADSSMDSKLKSISPDPAVPAAPLTEGDLQKLKADASILDRQKGQLNVHYIGSLDRLGDARADLKDFPIVPSKQPPVFLRHLDGNNRTSPSPSRVASLFKSPETRLDFHNDLIDDYDETELMELPNNFGPAPSQRESKLMSSTENIVDYREIFRKCYRNARRKTKALVEKEPSAATYGDLADDRVSQIAATVPWEPLVQQWFALGSDFQDGIMKEIDYENLIPMLFLGFEEVILRAQKRGLVPQDSETPRDAADKLEDPEFDPLETLGVFLIRNNPRHNNIWETDSYVHSFRKVIRQIRSEKTCSRAIEDFSSLAENIRTADGFPLLPPKDMGEKTKKASYASQNTSTFLMDGGWGIMENTESLMTEDSRRKLSAIVRLLAQPKMAGIFEEDGVLDTTSPDEHPYEVNVEFLKTFLLNFVEEVPNVVHQTKEAIRQVVRNLPNLPEEPVINEDDTVKILSRILRILRQTDLEQIQNYCKLFTEQSEESRKFKSRQAQMHELFEAMDETQARPTVVRCERSAKKSLLVVFFDYKGIYCRTKFLPAPGRPVTSIEQLDASSHEPALPPGSTPTVFDVDDYQSLLGDKTDTQLPIPEALTRSVEDCPIPQVEHVYVKHMYKQYSSSGSTGVIPVPEEDLPVSVTEKFTVGAVAAEEIAAPSGNIANKVYASYQDRLASRKRFESQSRQFWSVTSAPFRDTLLTKHQFTAVLGNVIADLSHDEIAIREIINRLRANYRESSDERIARLRQEQTQARNARRVSELLRAFDCLDNTGKGVVDLARLLDLWLFTGIPVKISQVNEILTAYDAVSKACSTNFTKEQFVDFGLILLNVCNLDIDTEQTEQTKIIMRKGWLADVRTRTASGGGNLDSLFRDIIELIEKDGQIHSGNKVIAASIALLEHNTLNPAKGKFLLRFVAASDRESRYLINRIYLPESQNIGFRVAQAGRPGRIEKISQNDTPLPVSSERKQAVLCCLSEGFVQIQTQRKCIVALAEGLPWFHILSPSIVDIQMYWVEPDVRVNDTPTLRKVVSTAGGSSPAVVYPNPAVYRQGDPGFFDRLLCCATSAENVKETLFKESFGSDWPKATKETDVVNLLVICQKTLNEVLSTMSGTFPQLAIQKQFPERQHRFIFHRLLLVDLRQVCKRIQASTLSDIRTAPDSSQVHQQILKAILTAFHPAESEQGYFDRWSGCKDAVRLDLMDTIVQFDPTVNLGIRSARTISKAFRGSEPGGAAPWNPKQI
ncbi:hypothetical protein BV898_15688 [Hypsibius exemplaris]|uniref:EF-hand domain-containing protein n=1 Tax=Hypsibius exemplaris TaxID=2072580 RepID=A0A9X6NBL0_HYPEX|nr:hypothetical protein BV898_15688 [Hypsibius exemplaris]